MSDEEEESASEGFSASEDEWRPTKNTRGGESSDDDDSEFEDSPTAGAAGGAAASRKRESEPKSRSATKPSATAAKKRKPMGQSLRTKLYNKYRPPPKTFPSPNSSGGYVLGTSSNSPTASTSKRQAASKNARTPNEGNERCDDGSGNNSSSESSVGDYLVNPDDLDLQSSFFTAIDVPKETSPAPAFDCNAGIAHLSDSGSEDNNDSSADGGDGGTQSKAFDFRHLLEKANSLERAKETIAQRTAAANEADAQGNTAAAAVTDISTLLALGENAQPQAPAPTVAPTLATKVSQRKGTATAGDRHGDTGGGGGGDDDDNDEVIMRGSQRLNKTKSTRIKRHTKTRPTSTVAAVDTDDSEFEEVAEEELTGGSGDGSWATTSHQSGNHNNSLAANGSLEIRVELPTRKRCTREERTQQELEMAFRRKLNRNLKDRQLQFHKATFLCRFARSYAYNRLANDTVLMQAALKLLPSQNAYPPDRGTELKYFQSLVTWFKTAVQLESLELHGPKRGVTKRHVKRELIEQLGKRVARHKEEYVMMFVILLRGMGLQCRMVVNLQPVALKPPQSQLLSLSLKPTDAKVGIAASQQAQASKSEPIKVESDIKKQPAKKEKSEVPKEAAKKSTSKDVVKSKVKPETKSKETKTESAAKLSTKPSTSSQAKGTKKPVAATKLESDPELLAARTGAKRKATKKETLEKLPKNAPAKSESLGKILTEAAATQPKKRLAKENAAEPKVKPNVEKEPVEIVRSRFFAQNEPTTSKAASQRRVPRKTAAEEATSQVETAPVPVKKPRVGARGQKAPPVIEVGSPKVPHIVLHKAATAGSKANKVTATKTTSKLAATKTATISPAGPRSRSKSPSFHISPEFLQSESYKEKLGLTAANHVAASTRARSRSSSKSPTNSKIQICPDFLKTARQSIDQQKRILRPRQKTNETAAISATSTPTRGSPIPQLDGAHDEGGGGNARPQRQRKAHVKASAGELDSDAFDSEDDFEPSPPKRPKAAPVLPKQVQQLRKNRDLRVLSSDEDTAKTGKQRRDPMATDIWVELWSDVEAKWICADICKGTLDAVEAIRRAATSSLAYVFAFQNDLSTKDVTARYCPHWTTTVRKGRVDSAWLDKAIQPYLGQRTERDRREDAELRRIHEEKPLPTTISDFKDHPLYALERHLLKFQAIYPPTAPSLGFIRGERVYSRDCVFTLHSREIWLKSARQVRLGEQPYKIVKARPKWDRLTQTVIKDQPLEIYGHWQTEDYDPPTAENGIVPRNAYGNVELFKACMLPKKTVHLKLNGLNRICKKLGIDCANAVIGFDFHQGACHPLYDGFVVCEEFGDQVTAAWYQDQEDQERKEQEKYEARVYGNWKKLIRGLLIRERLKKKYNF